MAKKTIHLKDISFVDGSVDVKINFERFEKQIGEAQYWLDNAIMASMEQFMPKDTGVFVNVTRAMSAAIAGSGTVIGGAPPAGRYLYMGKVMVDPATGSPYARKGAKKIVTSRDITYSNPKATPFWFETAKQRYGDAWVKGVKAKAGGDE